MTKKVSVLVPICNVEKYLSKCLESLVNQTLSDIEIICINDGSTDNSLKIIREYEKKDSRIVVIDKLNSGYGDSMNRGLEIATGEYIGIVESDDFADVNMFKDLYYIAKLNDVDIVRSKYYLFWDKLGGEINVDRLKIPYNRVFSPQEDPIVYMLPPAIWTSIYKKAFINENSIRFLPTPGASYQDTGFFLKSLYYANSMYITNQAYIYYRQDNPNSSVKKTKLEKALFVNEEFESAYNLFLTNTARFNCIKEIFATKIISTYLWNIYRIEESDSLKYAERLRKDSLYRFAADFYMKKLLSKNDELIVMAITSGNVSLVQLLLKLKKAKAKMKKALCIGGI